MDRRPLILIADDEDDVVQLLKHYLKPLDAEFLVATDRDEELAVAQARLTDVVLLDVMMPKRSGWDVCQALKAVQRTAQIRVVLVTGRGEVKDGRAGRQRGPEQHPAKPFN